MPPSADQCLALRSTRDPTTAAPIPSAAHLQTAVRMSISSHRIPRPPREWLSDLALPARAETALRAPFAPARGPHPPIHTLSRPPSFASASLPPPARSTSSSAAPPPTASFLRLRTAYHRFP